MKNIALVGYGYWGPNLLRNFYEAQNCEVLYVCDKDIERLKDVGRRYPSIIRTSNYSDILDDPKVDAVIIATPTKFHYKLAKNAIEVGKDILIEKPMTATIAEARNLTALAKKKNKLIMVDHTFLFTPAVRKIKKILDSGEIGDIIYIDAVRVNLGLFQKDSNVIFDLATHDVSIIQYLLDKRPLSISSFGARFYGSQEEIAYMHLAYPNKITCHVHVSWLSPLKMRKIMIVGTKKMLVYDDVELSEKVKVYDKGVVLSKLSSSSKEVEHIRIGYRSGDIWTPNLEVKEALSQLADEFIKNLERREVNVSSGKFGLEVVNILEKATVSCRSHKFTYLKNGNSK